MGDFFSWPKKKSSSTSTSTSTSTSHGSLGQKDNYKKEKSDILHFHMDRRFGPGNEKTPIQRYEYGKRSGHNPPEKLETLVKSPEHSEGLWSEKK